MPTTGHNTTDKTVIEEINKRLLDHGRSLDGRPVLRIVWSDDQFQLRKGWHEIWNSSGTIFLSRWFGVKNEHKYKYIPHRWILERLTYLPLNNKIVVEELLEEEVRKGIYECLYVFHDANFQPLPVNWRVVELILMSLRNSPSMYNGNPKAREEMRERFEEEEVGYFEEQLHQDGRSPTFAFENSVFNDSTKQPFWRKNNGRPPATT